MTIQVGAVKAFRGFPVSEGVVHVCNDGFIRHLDETYPEANVCNVISKAGNVLYGAFPVTFDKLKKEFAEELQDSLRSQLKAANDVDIDFH